MLELYIIILCNVYAKHELPLGLYQCTIVSSSGMKSINKLGELVLSKATWVNSEIFVLLFTSNIKQSNTYYQATWAAYIVHVVNISPHSVQRNL